ncbi:hypothetical protein ACP70R_042293 [Stipagrostis hirtigluma subsp. patula]
MGMQERPEHGAAPQARGPNHLLRVYRRRDRRNSNPSTRNPMASMHASFWSDLPAELLGLVLLRLHSLADRVRVGTVCRPWRSGARLQPLPPPMPWIALDEDTYLDTADNATHKLKPNLPSDARGGGSVDHLLIFLKRAGEGCFLVNPFSAAVLPVPDLSFFLEEQAQSEMFYSFTGAVKKVVARWPPVNPVVVAALITHGGDWHNMPSTVFVCRAGSGTAVDKESYGTMSVHLCHNHELLLVELGESTSGNPAITGVQYIIKNPCDVHEGMANPPGDGNLDHEGVANLRGEDNLDDEDDEMVDCILIDELFSGELYLVQSGDRLLKLQRMYYSCDTYGTHRFDVYEADFGASPCRWTPVRSLRGRALFLGKRGGGAKSVPAGDGRSGAQEDCIYFVSREFGDVIYNMRDGTITRLVPAAERAAVRARPCVRRWIRAWVFPDQVPGAPEILYDH